MPRAGRKPRLPGFPGRSSRWARAARIRSSRGRAASSGSQRRQPRRRVRPARSRRGSAASWRLDWCRGRRPVSRGRAPNGVTRRRSPQWLRRYAGEAVCSWDGPIGSRPACVCIDAAESRRARRRCVVRIQRPSGSARHWGDRRRATCAGRASTRVHPQHRWTRSSVDGRREARVGTRPGWSCGMDVSRHLAEPGAVVPGSMTFPPVRGLREAGRPATARPVCSALVEALRQHRRFAGAGLDPTTGRCSRPDSVSSWAGGARQGVQRQRRSRHLLTAPYSLAATTAKIERLHETIRAEFLIEHDRQHATIEDAQAALHGWVVEYNTEQPHQSCGGRPPVERSRWPRAVSSLSTSRCCRRSGSRVAFAAIRR